jgi:hypothetical protein
LSCHIRPVHELMPTPGVHTVSFGTANLVPVVKPEASATKTSYMKSKNEMSLSNVLSHKTQTYTPKTQVFCDVTLCHWVQ